MKNKKKMRKLTEAGKMWLWWQKKHKNNKPIEPKLQEAKND